MKTRFHSLLALAAVSLLLGPVPWATADPGVAIGPNPELHQKLVDKSIRYLRIKGQADDGSFSAGAGPGITALVTTSLMRNPQP